MSETGTAVGPSEYTDSNSYHESDTVIGLPVIIGWAWPGDLAVSP